MSRRTRPMQQAFSRSIESLGEIFGFTESFYEQERIESSHRFAVDLAVEELFTNMVKYTRGANDVQIRLERTDDRLTVRLTDFDVEAFDVTQAAEARVDLPIEQRRPGGLGIHLTRKLMDRIDYEYVDRTSTITLIKQLG